MTSRIRRFGQAALLLLGLLAQERPAFAAAEYPAPFVLDYVAPTNGGTLSNALLAPDGTSSLPGYAFSSQPALGLYRSAANTMAFGSVMTQLTMPAAAGLVWSGRSQVLSPADSQVQILPNAGGNGTSLVTGLILGTADANGASLVREGAGTARLMTGNQGANGTMKAAGFVLTNTDGTVRIGTATAGLAPGVSTLGLVQNSVTGVLLDNSGNATMGNTVVINGNATNNGAAATIQAARLTATTNGAAATQVVGAIPNGAIVWGVVSRVTTTITGATTFDVGDGSSATKWGAGLAVASGTTASSASFLDKSNVAVYTASENVVLTAHGGTGTFTGGAIEVLIYYVSLAAPTS